MELNGQRVLVVGMGKSGVSAALFLAGRKARVTVSDARAQDQLRGEIPLLLDRGIAVETGGHGERTFRDQDLIVVSPGVPVDHPQLVQARRYGVQTIGEVELASQFLKGKIVAITGSNGKTTTTSLVGEVLQKSGLKTQVGGNIGTPVTELIESSDDATWNVLEISSFQLETITSFRPHIAAVLNITPDHLDRHGSFEAYVAAKARIFENQTTKDFAVLNSDDAACNKLAAQVKAPLFWFSRNAKQKNGAAVQGGEIVFAKNGETVSVMPVSEIALKGAHNVENVLAAVTCAMLAGCSAGDVRRGVREFKAVEHRLELVAEIEGVSFYNDSKATNVDATIKALESFPGGIHLILGGKDKGSDYTVLRGLITERVKRVYTIGAAAEKIESQIAGAAPLLHVGTLERAVASAAAVASAGEIILLAPACASFDQFQSYEHRGRVFKELVAKLASPEVVRSRG